MTLTDKSRQLAEEVADGLPITSNRIYREIVEALASSIEHEIKMAVDDAGYRIEDYEEGRRDAHKAARPKPRAWWAFWRAA